MTSNHWWIFNLFYRLKYAGENFVRHTGDVKEFAKQQSILSIVNQSIN